MLALLIATVIGSKEICLCNTLDDDCLNRFCSGHSAQVFDESKNYKEGTKFIIGSSPLKISLSSLIKSAPYSKFMVPAKSQDPKQIIFTNNDNGEPQSLKLVNGALTDYEQKSKFNIEFLSENININLPKLINLDIKVDKKGKLPFINIDVSELSDMCIDINFHAEKPKFRFINPKSHDIKNVAILNYSPKYFQNHCDADVVKISSLDASASYSHDPFISFSKLILKVNDKDITDVKCAFSTKGFIINGSIIDKSSLSLNDKSDIIISLDFNSDCNVYISAGKYSFANDIALKILNSKSVTFSEDWNLVKKQTLENLKITIDPKISLISDDRIKSYIKFNEAIGSARINKNLSEATLEVVEVSCTSSSDCQTKLSENAGKYVVMSPSSDITLTLKDVNVPYLTLKNYYNFYITVDEEIDVYTNQDDTLIYGTHVNHSNYYIYVTTTIDGLNIHFKGSSIHSSIGVLGPFNLFIDNLDCAPSYSWPVDDSKVFKSITLDHYDSDSISFESSMGNFAFSAPIINVHHTTGSSVLSLRGIAEVRTGKSISFKIFSENLTLLKTYVNTNKDCYKVEIESQYQVRVKHEQSLREYSYLVVNDAIFDTYFICNSDSISNCSPSNLLNQGQIKLINEFPALLEIEKGDFVNFEFIIDLTSESSPLVLPDSFKSYHQFINNDQNQNLDPVYVDLRTKDFNGVELNSRASEPCLIVDQRNIYYSYYSNPPHFMINLGTGKKMLSRDSGSSSGSAFGKIDLYIKSSITIECDGEYTADEFNLISTNTEAIDLSIELKYQSVVFPFGEIKLNNVNLKLTGSDLSSFKNFKNTYSSLTINSNSLSALTFSDTEVGVSNSVKLKANTFVLESNSITFTFSVKTGTTTLPTVELKATSSSQISVSFDSTWESYLTSASSIKFTHPNANVVISSGASSTPNIVFDPPANTEVRYCVCSNDENCRNCPSEVSQINPTNLFKLFDDNQETAFEITLIGFSLSDPFKISRKYLRENNIVVTVYDNNNNCIEVDEKASKIYQKQNDFRIDDIPIHFPTGTTVITQLSNDAVIEQVGGTGYLHLRLNLTEDTTLTIKGDAINNNEYANYFFNGDYVLTIFPMISCASQLNSIKKLRITDISLYNNINYGKELDTFYLESEIIRISSPQKIELQIEDIDSKFTALNAKNYVFTTNTSKLDLDIDGSKMTYISSIVVNCDADDVYLDLYDKFVTSYGQINGFALKHAGRITEHMSTSSVQQPTVNYQPSENIVRDYFCIKHENENGCSNFIQSQVFTGLSQISNANIEEWFITIDTTSFDKPFELTQDFFINRKTSVDGYTDKQYIYVKDAKKVTFTTTGHQFSDCLIPCSRKIVLLVKAFDDDTINLYDTIGYQMTKNDFIIVPYGSFKLVLDGSWPTGSGITSVIKFQREAGSTKEINVTFEYDQNLYADISFDDLNYYNFIFSSRDYYNRFFKKERKVNKIYYKTTSNTVIIEAEQFTLEDVNIKYSRANGICVITELTTCKISQASTVTLTDACVMFMTPESTLTIDESCSKQAGMTIKYEKKLYIKFKGSELPYTIDPAENYEIIDSANQEFCVVDSESTECPEQYPNKIIRDAFIQKVKDSTETYLEVLLLTSIRIDVSIFNGKNVNLVFLGSNVPLLRTDAAEINIGSDQIVIGTTTLQCGYFNFLCTSPVVKIKLSAPISLDHVPRFDFEGLNNIEVFDFTEGSNYEGSGNRFTFKQIVGLKISLANVPIGKISSVRISDFETLNLIKCKISDTLFIDYNELSSLQVNSDKLVINGENEILKSKADNFIVTTESSKIDFSIGDNPMNKLYGLTLKKLSHIKILEYHAISSFSVEHDGVLITYPDSLTTKPEISLLPFSNYAILKESEFSGKYFCIGTSECDGKPSIETGSVELIIALSMQPSISFKFGRSDYPNSVTMKEESLAGKTLVEFIGLVDVYCNLELTGIGNVPNKNLKISNMNFRFSKVNRMLEDTLTFNELSLVRTSLNGGDNQFAVSVNKLNTDIFSICSYAVSSINVATAFTMTDDAINQVTFSSDSAVFVNNEYLTSNPVIFSGESKIVTKQSEPLTLSVAPGTTSVPQVEIVLENEGSSSVKIDGSFDELNNVDGLKLNFKSENAVVDSESSKVPTIESNNNVEVNKPGGGGGEGEGGNNGEGGNQGDGGGDPNNNLPAIIGSAVGAVVVIVVAVVIVVCVVKRKRNRSNSSSSSMRKSDYEI